MVSIEMWGKIVLFFYFSRIYCVRREFQSSEKENAEDLSIESEYDVSKYNMSKYPTTTGHTTKAEMAVEKFVDTMMASEKYLKMIELIEKKVNHLDITFTERTNTILKYVTEVLRLMRSSPVDILENALQSLKSELDKLKRLISHQADDSLNLRADSIDCHLEENLDHRLSLLETHMKSVMNSIDTIANVISEVKSRQRSRNLHKSDVVGASVDPTSLINEFRRVVQEHKAKKCDCKTGRVDRSERYPTDCQEIQAQGFNITGIYKIRPDEMEPFYVLCDLNTAGGGWTVIQNRFDGSQDFFKNWLEYKHGFGNLAGEFWLGLEKIYYLTNQKLYELRVEMESQDGQELAFGTYSVFTLGPEYEGYRISTIGTFRGTGGDSLSYHAGQKFSTHDVDNDDWKEGSCANEHGGAWWYKECDKSNLNGKYSTSADDNGQSMYWISFKGPHSPLSKTRMMIRPLPASRPMEYNEKNRSTKLWSDRSRGKDMKGGSREAARPRLPYHFDDVQPDVFFPNYA